MSRNNFTIPKKTIRVRIIQSCSTNWMYCICQSRTYLFPVVLIYISIKSFVHWDSGSWHLMITKLFIRRLHIDNVSFFGCCFSSMDKINSWENLSMAEMGMCVCVCVWQRRMSIECHSDLFFLSSLSFHFYLKRKKARWPEVSFQFLCVRCKWHRLQTCEKWKDWGLSS